MTKKMDTSGKFVLRTGAKLHARLRTAALKSGLSLNQLCLNLLESRLKRSQILPQGFDWLQDILSSIPKLNLEIEGIILFGSAARGDFTEKSDIDLLIVLNKTASLSTELYRKWDEIFKDRIFNKISPQFVILPHNPKTVGSLWLEAAIDGIILYDAKDNIRKTIQNIRLFIAAGEVKRKISHGHPYWVFKISR